MDLLQVGDGEGSGVWGRGGQATAAVQRGQMVCKEGAKAQEILVMGNPQRAFREGAGMLGILGVVALSI